MAISNVQYDEIMRGYHARQLRNKDITKERQAWGYQQEPRLKEIDDTISSLSVEAARKMLDGNTGAFSELKQKLSDLRMEKAALIQSLGVDADYFQPVYT